MIIVKIEYDSNLTVSASSLERVFSKDILLDLRDMVEPTIGNLFAGDLDHVGIRIRPFEQFDEFDESIFFTITVVDESSSYSIAYINKQFGVTMAEYLREFIHNNITLKSMVQVVRGSSIDSASIFGS